MRGLTALGATATPTQAFSGPPLVPENQRSHFNLKTPQIFGVVFRAEAGECGLDLLDELHDFQSLHSSCRASAKSRAVLWGILDPSSPFLLSTPFPRSPGIQPRCSSAPPPPPLWQRTGFPLPAFRQSLPPACPCAGRSGRFAAIHAFQKIGHPTRMHGIRQAAVWCALAPSKTPVQHPPDGTEFRKKSGGGRKPYPLLQREKRPPARPRRLDPGGRNLAARRDRSYRECPNGSLYQELKIEPATGRRALAG